MREYTKDELLALTPERYLANGYLDAAGRVQAELNGDHATAAATQLRAAETPAQELIFAFEALKILLAKYDGTPRARAGGALEEALVNTAQMIHQPNNPGLVHWLRACAAAIRQPADIDAMLGHILAVVRLYTAIAAMQPPAPA